MKIALAIFACALFSFGLAGGFRALIDRKWFQRFTSWTMDFCSRWWWVLIVLGLTLYALVFPGCRWKATGLDLTAEAFARTRGEVMSTRKRKPHLANELAPAVARLSVVMLAGGQPQGCKSPNRGGILSQRPRKTELANVPNYQRTPYDDSAASPDESHGRRKPEALSATSRERDPKSRNASCGSSNPSVTNASVGNRNPASANAAAVKRNPARSNAATCARNPAESNASSDSRNPWEKIASQPVRDPTSLCASREDRTPKYKNGHRCRDLRSCEACHRSVEIRQVQTRHTHSSKPNPVAGLTRIENQSKRARQIWPDTRNQVSRPSHDEHRWRETWAPQCRKPTDANASTAIINPARPNAAGCGRKPVIRNVSEVGRTPTAKSVTAANASQPRRNPIDAIESRPQWIPIAENASGRPRKPNRPNASRPLSNPVSVNVSGRNRNPLVRNAAKPRRNPSWPNVSQIARNPKRSNALIHDRTGQEVLIGSRLLHDDGREGKVNDIRTDENGSIVCVQVFGGNVLGFTPEDLANPGCSWRKADVKPRLRRRSLMENQENKTRRWRPEQETRGAW